MTSNDGLILLEQFGHLGLSQPHGVVLQADINLSLTALYLIYDNLVLFHSGKNEAFEIAKVTFSSKIGEYIDAQTPQFAGMHKY